MEMRACAFAAFAAFAASARARRALEIRRACDGAQEAIFLKIAHVIKINSIREI